MKVLVVGGTGNVGSEVTHALVEQGVDTRVMSRKGYLPKGLPPGTIEAVQGDLEKPGTLAKAFEGASAMFLVNALSQSETAQGLAAVQAAQQAGLDKIVYMSVMMPKGSEAIPHFATKIPVEQAVRESGLKWTILRPSEFFQNDFRLKDAIVAQGVYPTPIGAKGVTRVDVRDIADGAVKALLDDGHQGRIYPLNGPRAWTGADTAQIYGEHLGRAVAYGGDDLEAWGKHVSAFLPEWLVRDLKVMYQFFQDHGLQAKPEELESQRQLLGHDPRAFETFVWELARGWRAAAAKK